MKNIQLIIALSFILFANSMAQDITAKLGGSSTSETYTITDNSGGELFKVNGAGDAYLTRDLKLSNTSVMYLGSNKFLSCPDKNTFLGRYAGSGNTANYNTFIGYNSGNSNTTGSSNTFLGRSSGSNNTTGKNNTFIGQQSGAHNVGGEENTFLGRNSGYENTAGNYNTFLGESAGNSNLAGEKNTFVGYNSGYENVSGNYNTFIGNESGKNVEDGTYNVMIGYQSGSQCINGYNNVFIGAQAGMSSTGNRNVFIGAAAGANEDGSDLLFIDNSSTSDPLIKGNFLSNEITINGNLTVTGTFSNPSDIRYKKNISTLDNALQNIQKVRGVYFNWNKEKYPDLVVSDKKQIGVIAQEIEKVYPELVKTDDKGFKSVDYSKLSAVLIEAVKEQQTEIDELKSALQKLQTQFNSFAKNQNNLSSGKTVKVSLSK